MMDKRFINPLLLKWFKKNSDWHPLTGDLPIDYLSQEPQNPDMRCAELILKARGLWGVRSWYADDPDLPKGRILFDLAHQIISRENKGGRLGPDQIPEGLIEAEAKMELKGPIEQYKIFAVLSIRFAWDALRKTCLEGAEVGPEIITSKDLFSKAAQRAQWLRHKKEISERGRKGGSASKKEPAFVSLTKWGWQYSKKKGARLLWKYLTKQILENDRIPDLFAGGQGLDFDFDQTRNRIIFYPITEKPKSMGFRSFQRYVADLKKELKKKSQ
jgi:hypothetical protein